MEGPPLGPGGEDITWPDQVAPRGRKASSTAKSNLKPQTTNECIFTKIAETFWEKSEETAPWSLSLLSAISGDVHSLFWVPYVLRWQGMWR